MAATRAEHLYAAAELYVALDPALSHFYAWRADRFSRRGGSGGGGSGSGGGAALNTPPLCPSCRALLAPGVSCSMAVVRRNRRDRRNQRRKPRGASAALSLRAPLAAVGSDFWGKFAADATRKKAARAPGGQRRALVATCGACSARSAVAQICDPPAARTAVRHAQRRVAKAASAAPLPKKSKKRKKRSAYSLSSLVESSRSGGGGGARKQQRHGAGMGGGAQSVAPNASSLGSFLATLGGL